MQKSLAQFLKELRQLNHYSQEFVSSHLNIIRQTYSHYETGRIMPPTDALYKLSQLYHVPIEQFFSFQDTSRSASGAVRNTNVQADSLLHESSGSYILQNFSTRYPVDLDALTPNDLEMLYYYQHLELNDKKDILDFLKIKYQRYKKG